MGLDLEPIKQRLLWDSAAVEFNCHKDVPALVAEVDKLRAVLKRVSRQTLPPTRAIGCVECRSFDVKKHNRNCIVGAVLGEPERGET